MVQEKTVKRYTEEDLNDPEQFPEFADDPEEDDYEDYDEDEDLEDEEIPEGFDHIGTFEEIAAIDDLAEEKFYVSAWKCSVLLKGVTKREFDHMRISSKSRSARGRSNEVLEREIVKFGLVQPRIVTDAQYNILMERSAGAIVSILNRIVEKSGLDTEAEKKRERRFPRKR